MYDIFVFRPTPHRPFMKRDPLHWRKLSASPASVKKGLRGIVDDLRDSNQSLIYAL